jgi:DNA mismatch repair protein MutS
LFNELVYALSEYIAAIQLNANILARIDCLMSFAACAEDYNIPVRK